MLGGRFFAYAWFRLRFFVGSSLLRVCLHLIEFTILALIFSQDSLLSVLLIRTLGRLLAAWWWGALEHMRSQLRDLYRQSKSYLIPNQLPPWLSIATACAILVMILTVGWILLDINRPIREFEVFHLFVFATGLRLSLALITQTYHATVYAIRRVYRPFIALVGIPLLGFLGTLIAWPVLGHWAFPIIVIPTMILSSFVTFLYVYRMYRFLGLRPIRFRDPHALVNGFRHLMRRDIQTAGFAYAATRLDELLTLSLVYLAYQNPASYDLVIALYLISPLSRAAYEWARLWYFDFKKLELGLFLSLRNKFDRFSRRVAWVIGFGFWGLACLVATLVTQQHLGALYVLLLGLFLARAHLALYQIRAFSDGRYGLLIVSGLLILGGTTHAFASMAGGTERFTLYILILIVVMLLLAVQCAAFINRGTTSHRV